MGRMFDVCDQCFNRESIDNGPALQRTRLTDQLFDQPTDRAPNSKSSERHDYGWIRVERNFAPIPSRRLNNCRPFLFINFHCQLSLSMMAPAVAHRPRLAVLDM